MLSKILSIFIASLVLLQSVNLNFIDLVELDELLEHYQFHQEEYGDNFLVFVSKHYGELKVEHSQKHQEEQSDHEKLPFQQQTPSMQLVVLFNTLNPFSSSTTEIANRSSANYYYHNFYSFDWAEGPFQPPKQA